MHVVLVKTHRVHLNFITLLEPFHHLHNLPDKQTPAGILPSTEYEGNTPKHDDAISICHFLCQPKKKSILETLNIGSISAKKW